MAKQKNKSNSFIENEIKEFKERYVPYLRTYKENRITTEIGLGTLIWNCSNLLKVLPYVTTSQAKKQIIDVYKDLKLSIRRAILDYKLENKE